MKNFCCYCFKMLNSLEQQHVEEGTEISYMSPVMYIHSSPMISITRMVHLLSKMNLHWLIHNSHPKSLVYFRFIFGKFCGFGQIYNDIYPSVLNGYWVVKIHMLALPLNLVWKFQFLTTKYDVSGRAFVFCSLYQAEKDFLNSGFYWSLYLLTVKLWIRKITCAALAVVLKLQKLRTLCGKCLVKMEEVLNFVQEEFF